MSKLRTLAKRSLWEIFGPLGLLASVEKAILYGQSLLSPRHRAARHRQTSRCDFYSQFLKQDALCFDIGANYGNRVDAFLCVGAHIIAVEPQGLPLRYLNLKYGRNDHVTIVPVGVAAQAGEQTLHIASNAALSSMSEKTIALEKPSKFDGRVEVVQVTTLDELIAQYGMPDFLKIDIEGFEYEAFKGLTQAVPQLSFEYKPNQIEITLSCIEYLSQLGNYEFNYVVGESLTFGLPQWVNGVEMIDFAAQELSQQKAAFGDIYGRLLA